MMGRISGRDAVGIMIQEIGEAIGAQRLREFERKVRYRIRLGHPNGATGQDWINAMSDVIVADDDAKADAGFQKGIARIRQEAARR